MPPPALLPYRPQLYFPPRHASPSDMLCISLFLISVSTPGTYTDVCLSCSLPSFQALDKQSRNEGVWWLHLGAPFPPESAESWEGQRGGFCRGDTGAHGAPGPASSSQGSKVSSCTPVCRGRLKPGHISALTLQSHALIRARRPQGSWNLVATAPSGRLPLFLAWGLHPQTSPDLGRIIRGHPVCPLLGLSRKPRSRDGMRLAQGHRASQ